MTETKRAIEAVLMAAIEPIEPQLLAQLTETPVDEIEALCTELHDEYERDGRGFTLVKIAGGYRYQTHADMAPYIERFVLDGQSAGCRVRRSRRWRSSPTSSRCRAPSSPRSAG